MATTGDILIYCFLLCLYLCAVGCDMCYVICDMCGVFCCLYFLALALVVVCGFRWLSFDSEHGIEVCLNSQ